MFPYSNPTNGGSIRFIAGGDVTIATNGISPFYAPDPRGAYAGTVRFMTDPRPVGSLLLIR